jgi:hypothetical protein
MQYVVNTMAVQKITVIAVASSLQNKGGVIIASTATTPPALFLAEH